MATADRNIGGVYPEELLLEAHNLEWAAIELRCKRVRKTWQQMQLASRMEQQERRYRRRLRRLQRQEQQKQQRELKARKEAARLAAERAAAILRQREALKARIQQRREQQEQMMEGDTSMEEGPVESRKVVRPVQKAEKKRIAPVSLPSKEPEVEYPPELEGYDSPPPELPADELLNVLSLDKGSESDVDDEPSMVSLILPVAQNSPRKDKSAARKKKVLTPQKRLAKKGGAPMDFNFTNAEARRQANAAALAEQDDDDDDGEEPEAMPSPSTLTPKKRLKRRKEVAMERQSARSAAASTGGRNLMAAMAKTTVATVKHTKTAGNTAADKRKSGTTTIAAARRKPVGAVAGNARKDIQSKAKHTYTAEVSTKEEVDAPVPPQKKRPAKGEKMTIKQRLANAEMLARLSKMQDISTPKVLSKKIKKTQKKSGPKTLAAKRAEFRKILSNDEPSKSRRDEGIEEQDLNISLNSSLSGGQISDDNDFPDNPHVTKRKKRKRVTAGADATPTKKLQFLEITKRLVKSPMPRFLRTPTPLMSPAIASALVKPHQTASSPNPRGISGRGGSELTTPLTKAAAQSYSSSRMNAGLPRAKKTPNANTFGIPPGGGGGAAASAGGFSMFDAFVNSGSGGAIPRLKTTNRGDESPTV